MYSLARHFHRDVSTIHHAVRKIEYLRSDPDFDQFLDEMAQKLDNPDFQPPL